MEFFVKKQLVNFDFNGNAVRVHLDEKGDTWFVAADVCAALGIVNPTRAIANLNVDEKQVVEFKEIHTMKGFENQQLNDSNKINIVSESGLYYLVFKSRKPQARKFTKWVTSEVLPQIRKTGTYSVNPEKTKLYDILSYISRANQVRCQKAMSELATKAGGEQCAIDWNAHNTFAHTGLYPRQWRNLAATEGSPGISGIDAVRKFNPAAACGISLTNNLLVETNVLPLDAIEAGKLSHPLFKKLIDLGITPAELEGKTHE